MYKASQEEGAEMSENIDPNNDGTDTGGTSETDGANETIVDAEFEEVDSETKNNEKDEEDKKKDS